MDFQNLMTMLSSAYLIILSYYYYAPISELPGGKNFGLYHFLSSIVLAILTFRIHPITPFLLSFLLEFNQIFIPYRYFDLYDLASNFSGAFFGIFLLVLSRKIIFKMKE